MYVIIIDDDDNKYILIVCNNFSLRERSTSISLYITISITKFYCTYIYM